MFPTVFSTGILRQAASGQVEPDDVGTAGLVLMAYTVENRVSYLPRVSAEFPSISREAFRAAHRNLKEGNLLQGTDYFPVINCQFEDPGTVEFWDVTGKVASGQARIIS